MNIEKCIQNNEKETIKNKNIKQLVQIPTKSLTIIKEKRSDKIF